MKNLYTLPLPIDLDFHNLVLDLSSIPIFFWNFKNNIPMATWTSTAWTVSRNDLALPVFFFRSILLPSPFACWETSDFITQRAENVKIFEKFKEKFIGRCKVQVPIFTKTLMFFYENVDVFHWNDWSSRVEKYIIWIWLRVDA